MFANIFSFKKTPVIDYKELYQQLSKEYTQLDASYMSFQKSNEKLVDEFIDLKQRHEKVDIQNSILGNAMFEIVEAGSVRVPNGTTKKIVNIAKTALGQVANPKG